MSLLDLLIGVFQVAVPVALLAWLFLAPAGSLLLYVVQVVTIALCLIAPCRVPTWLAKIESATVRGPLAVPSAGANRAHRLSR